MMNKGWAAAAILVAVQGCATGLYPDTDLVEPKDFDLKVATGIQKSGGLLQAGNLEYAGTGDLVAEYRAYVADMRIHGWTGAADDIQGQKAVGTLRKDNRTCSLEFTSAGGQIRITIKVTQTKN
ncbi:MAG TPA: hypothetical protein VKW04_17145 [Planctomycetota bacterium]|nr:hypothetical protein [Planctomycetota bacterium]